MRVHTDITYDLNGTALLALSHKDGTVSLHTQDYVSGVGVCLRFNTSHLESCRDLVQYLELFAKEQSQCEQK